MPQLRNSCQILTAVAASDCSQSTDDECGIFAHRDLVHEINPCEFHEPQIARLLDAATELQVFFLTGCEAEIILTALGLIGVGFLTVPVRFQLTWACFVIGVALLSSTSVHAQLPFYTDDADTTAKGKFHLELSNEHDWLQGSSFPGRRQNTTVLTLNYGLTERIELGVNAPFIKIFNDRSSLLGNPSGFGDTQFGVKIRLLEEREGSKVPAASVVFYVEAPTGPTRKQIGSGLVDYWLYGVLQKSLTKRTTGRLNGGVLFAGNSSTGLLGIRATRGQVFTGNGSLVRQFTPKLRLGTELFGAVTNNFELSRGQLVGQVGGGYALAENFELTFGVLGGRFSASPRLGFQVGFAYDFK